MKFLVHLYLIIFGKKIGKDIYNNIYYEVINKKNNKVKRLVIFQGLNESTKVPPEWESWLRFVTNEPIINKHQNINSIYLPNLTGTIYAYTYTKYTNTKKYKSHSYWQG